jgi:hypothetical protein
MTIIKIQLFSREIYPCQNEHEMNKMLEKKILEYIAKGKDLF